MDSIKKSSEYIVLQKCLSQLIDSHFEKVVRVHYQEPHFGSRDEVSHS